MSRQAIWVVRECKLHDPIQAVATDEKSAKEAVKECEYTFRKMGLKFHAYKYRPIPKDYIFKEELTP